MGRPSLTTPVCLMVDRRLVLPARFACVSQAASWAWALRSREHRLRLSRATKGFPMIRTITARGLSAFVLLASILAAACGADEASDDLQDDSDSALGTPQPCGGRGARACSSRKICVDDPRDTCEPQGFGADCAGVCIGASTLKCAGKRGLS